MCNQMVTSEMVTREMKPLLKAKAKRPTTKNKTKRKKQRKSNSWLRGLFIIPRNRTEKTDL